MRRNTVGLHWSVCIWQLGNYYDSALLKLEVVLTVNCFQIIFVCFYLFMVVSLKKTQEMFPSGNEAMWGLLPLGSACWEQQCTVSQQWSEKPTQTPPYTWGRALGALPKRHILAITIILTSSLQLGCVEVLLQTYFTLFRDFTLI